MKRTGWGRCVVLAGAAWVLAGCVMHKAPVEEVSVEPDQAKPVACSPAPEGSPLTGTWLSTTRPHGVVGDFRALVVLSADGAMSYETQLKVGRRIRPGLRETGCWQVDEGVLTLQTKKSNGEWVDATDAIYQNRYRVEKAASARLTLRELKRDGQLVTARRVQPGYRLSY